MHRNHSLSFSSRAVPAAPQPVAKSGRLRTGEQKTNTTAWTVPLAAPHTSSEEPKCPSARVLHGLGALAKPGAKRQTQAGVAGWPDFGISLG